MMDHFYWALLRRKYSVTQKQLAEKLGITTADLRSMESGKVLPTFDIISKLKEALGIQDIPISGTDVHEYVHEDLRYWRDLIDRYNLEDAEALRPELERRANESVHILPKLYFELYSARYYRAANNMEAYNNTMAYLNKRKGEIKRWPGLQYLYLRLQGMQAIAEHRYKKALDTLIAAGKYVEREFDISGDVALYYSIGYCLTELHNPNMAIGYLEKAQWYADTRGNHVHDLYIQCLLAQNHSKIGENNKAINILKNRLRNEKRKNRNGGPGTPVGYVYHYLGTIYHAMESYSEAIASYESALGFHDKESEAYLGSLYNKSLALMDSGICGASLFADFDEGINLSRDGTIWETVFNALKCSATLSNAESHDYILNIAIPKLQEYGLEENVVRHYKALSDFYEVNGLFDKALEYSRLALELNKKIMNNLSKGD